MGQWVCSGFSIVVASMGITEIALKYIIKLGALLCLSIAMPSCFNIEWNSILTLAVFADREVIFAFSQDSYRQNIEWWVCSQNHKIK